MALDGTGFWLAVGLVNIVNVIKGLVSLLFFIFAINIFKDYIQPLRPEMLSQQYLLKI